MTEKGMRDTEEYSSGFSDNLTPVVSLDLNKCKSFSDLAKAMSNTAFGGRRLGEAADVLYEMTKDPDCFVVLTLSGAMTVAKMGLVICDMIDKGMVNAIVSTGALMAHGFIESTGMTHFKYDPGMDDKKLYYKGYNRVYDTLELEKNLDDAEVIVMKMLDSMDEHETFCSYKINEKLGEYLGKNTKGRGVLKSAFEKKVPVFIPAFTDSEFGIDFAVHNKRREVNGKKNLRFDPYEDMKYFADLMLKQKKLGIFTIGGGVPRNWTQQIGPYLEIMQKRVGKEHGGFKRFQYGVRICPEPVHWGGLSGCTFSEGISWGKFVPPSEGGKYSEVLCDATIAWPIIVKSVMERLEK